MKWLRPVLALLLVAAAVFFFIHRTDLLLNLEDLVRHYSALLSRAVYQGSSLLMCRKSWRSAPWRPGRGSGRPGKGAGPGDNPRPGKRLRQDGGHLRLGYPQHRLRPAEDGESPGIRIRGGIRAPYGEGHLPRLRGTGSGALQGGGPGGHLRKRRGLSRTRQRGAARLEPCPGGRDLVRPGCHLGGRLCYPGRAEVLPEAPAHLPDYSGGTVPLAPGSGVQGRTGNRLQPGPVRPGRGGLPAGVRGGALPAF